MGAICMAVISTMFPWILQKRVSQYSMIRVAIADDHPEMRVSLRLLLSMSKDIELVFETSNGQEAVDCVKLLQPDVLVMDIQMPVLDGFKATRQITGLSVPTRVILMSTSRGTIIVREAIAVGARGFVPKDILVASLLLAIEIVHRGESYFVE
jgi:DNA-binding NarL/FixJ family response regulator